MKIAAALLFALAAAPAFADPVWQYQQLIVSASQYQCWHATLKRSVTCHLDGTLNDIKLITIGPFLTLVDCNFHREANRYVSVPVNSGGITVEIQSVDNPCIEIDRKP